MSLSCLLIGFYSVFTVEISCAKQLYYFVIRTFFILLLALGQVQDDGNQMNIRNGFRFGYGGIKANG